MPVRLTLLKKYFVLFDLQTFEGYKPKTKLRKIEREGEEEKKEHKKHFEQKEKFHFITIEDSLTTGW